MLPYVYASEADDARVIAVIAEMAAGQIDAIAFTSAPQVRRFRDVARALVEKRNCGKAWNVSSLRRSGRLLQQSSMRLECR